MRCNAMRVQAEREGRSDFGVWRSTRSVVHPSHRSASMCVSERSIAHRCMIASPALDVIVVMVVVGSAVQCSAVGHTRSAALRAAAAAAASTCRSPSSSAACRPSADHSLTHMSCSSSSSSSMRTDKCSAHATIQSAIPSDVCVGDPGLTREAAKDFAPPTSEHRRPAPMSKHRPSNAAAQFSDQSWTTEIHVRSLELSKSATLYVKSRVG